MVKKVAGGTERGKVKVRFFEIEMEGDTDALQESLRSLTSAINKPVSQSQRQLTSTTSNGARNLSSGIEATEGEVLDSDESDLLEAEDAEEAASSKPARQRARRTPPTPQILDNLGLDSGDPKWDVYAADKSPTSDVLRVAVLATWFKRAKGLDSITIDHAYTAYKYVDWQTPDDIGQAFRNAKRTKNWFGTDGSGNWTINIIGINAVDKLKKGDG